MRGPESGGGGGGGGVEKYEFLAIKNSCGHISKLVPLGGNFRNAFINPILEILECLNLLL